MIISDGKGGWTHCPGSLQTNREIAREAKKHGFPPKGYGIDWQTCKKFKLTEKWTRIWEKFAGKPYKKPTKLTPGTIKGTFKQAQELLNDLGRHGPYSKRVWRRAGIDQLPEGIEIAPLECPRWQISRALTYPQSLGELCIELAQDRIRGATGQLNLWSKSQHHYRHGAMAQMCSTIRHYRREIQDLRRAMYHRGTI